MEYQNVNVKLSPKEHHALLKRARKERRPIATMARILLQAKGAGLRTKDHEAKPTKWVVIRLERAEFIELKDAAGQQEITLSDLCRSHICGYILVAE